MTLTSQALKKESGKSKGDPFSVNTLAVTKDRTTKDIKANSVKWECFPNKTSRSVETLLKLQNMRLDPLFALCLVWLVMLLVCTPSVLAEREHARRMKRQMDILVYAGGENAKTPSTAALLNVPSSRRRPPVRIYKAPRRTRRRCWRDGRYIPCN
ncbi:uncharacterized protein LOC134764215 [Penaeus indicus]|uniref:uncharacterized protein LOC134764215 n=1 Tax=Penaeus indicus TaxID=29960 RepID=UPI00300D2386